MTHASIPKRTTFVEGGMSWCSWWRCVPAWRTDSEEDVALYRNRLHSEDTLETVVVRFGEDIWPEESIAVVSHDQTR